MTTTSEALSHDALRAVAIGAIIAVIIACLVILIRIKPGHDHRHRQVNMNTHEFRTPTAFSDETREMPAVQRPVVPKPPPPPKHRDPNE